MTQPLIIYSRTLKYGYFQNWDNKIMTSTLNPPKLTKIFHSKWKLTKTNDFLRRRHTEKSDFYISLRELKTLSSLSMKLYFCKFLNILSVVCTCKNCARFRSFLHQICTEKWVYICHSKTHFFKNQKLKGNGIANVDNQIIAISWKI